MLECQVPSSLDEVDGDQPAYLTQQDYSTSAGYPVKEATGGFKGAFKKVANGIAGTQIAPHLCSTTTAVNDVVKVVVNGTTSVTVYNMRTSLSNLWSTAP